MKNTAHILPIPGKGEEAEGRGRRGGDEGGGEEGERRRKRKGEEGVATLGAE